MLQVNNTNLQQQFYMFLVKHVILYLSGSLYEYSVPFKEP